MDFGLAPGSLTSNAIMSGMRTGHLVQLTNLTSATTYYYTVSSADSADNSSTGARPAGELHDRDAAVVQLPVLDLDAVSHAVESRRKRRGGR